LAASPYGTAGQVPTAALSPVANNERTFFSWENAMRKTAIALMLAGLGAAGLYGCDVKKTQEGKYEVTPPDVKVSKTEKQVTVPKVTTQKETVTVPKIEVTPADQQAGKK